MDVTANEYITSVLSISSWLMFIPMLIGYFIGQWTRPKGAPKSKSVNIRKVIIITIASASIWIATGDTVMTAAYYTVFLLCSIAMNFMISSKSIMLCLSFTVVAAVVTAIVLCVPNLVCGYLLIGVLEGYVASVLNKVVKKRSRTRSRR